jgi:DNA (cytosine-5)-methyltransferase 1
MTSYYNEIDPHAAQWLRNLIAAGHIPAGDVDERSINDVRPSDLAGYVQCHFFAGIGGWAYALRLAGWPDDRPVWTGSCPCQPFSVAGTGAGFADERHLWPAWFHLIEQCRPVVIFGEQVEAAIRHDWLDLVHADLEGAGYTVGAGCLPAASVGAPHQRQRLWFVADSDSERLGRTQEQQTAKGSRVSIRSGGGEFGSMADASRTGLERREREPERTPEFSAGAGGMDGAPWSELEWLPCADGKTRPTRPGLFPLAHGVSGRMGRLRAYGNAIVPQVAAEFITAYLGAPT